MKTVTLYTGNGVTFSPRFEDGMTESGYVRLIADNGMMLKEDDKTSLVVDVLAADAGNWTEVEYVEPVEDELTAEEALDILIGGGEI